MTNHSTNRARRAGPLRRIAAALSLLAIATAGCAGAPDAAPPKVAAPAAPPLADASSRAAKRRITRRDDWVSVRLAAPPLTRVRCSFDAASGSHEEIEWDPAQPSALVKLVRLRGRTSRQRAWSVACSADALAIRSSSGPERLFVLDVDKQPRDLPATPSSAGAAPIAELHGRLVDMLAAPPQAPAAPPAQPAPEAPAPRRRAAQDEPAPLRVHVSITPIEAPPIGQLNLGEALLPAAGRSIDPLPAAAAELFKVLAEIAVERARSQAAALLAGEIRRAICDELTWNDAIRRALGLRRAPADPRLLPRTCNAVVHLRIDEIATSAESLGRELLSDLTELATFVLAEHLAALPAAPPVQDAPRAALALAPPPAGARSDAAPRLSTATRGPDVPRLEAILPIVRGASRLASDVALRRGPPSERDAQMLLVELMRAQYGEDDCKADPRAPACRWSCGMELVGALVDECHRAGSCGPAEVRERIEQAVSGQGDLDLHECKDALATIRADWPEIGQLVVEGFDVLRPPAGTNARAVVKRALNLVFDLLEHGACAPPPAKATPDAASLETSCAVVRSARDVVNGGLDGELHRAVLAGAMLVEHAIRQANLRMGCGSDDQPCEARYERWACKGLSGDALAECVAGGRAWADQAQTLRGVTRVLGAVTAYSATYAADAKGDPEQSRAQHEARKKAMESLIDATTDRNHKGGKIVWSLGAALGFQAGAQLTRASGDVGGLPPSLSLPTGIAVQRLPRSQDLGASWLASHSGWHVQLSPIDLGQLLAVDGAGKVATPRPDSFFTVALQGGLLLGTSANAVVIGADVRYSPTLLDKGALRFGGFVGFYVPFVDFN